LLSIGLELTTDGLQARQLCRDNASDEDAIAAQVVEIAASMKSVLAIVKLPQNESESNGSGGGGGGGDAATHVCGICGKSYFTAQDLATHTGLRHDNTLVLNDEGVPVAKVDAAAEAKAARLREADEKMQRAREADAERQRVDAARKQASAAAAVAAKPAPTKQAPVRGKPVAAAAAPADDEFGGALDDMMGDIMGAIGDLESSMADNNAAEEKEKARKEKEAADAAAARKRQQDEAAKKQADEAAKKQAAAAEEARRRKAAEDEKRRADEERQRKADEERQRKADEERQRKTDEEERKREEERQRKEKEEERRRQAEEERKRKAEEEKRKADADAAAAAKKAELEAEQKRQAAELALQRKAAAEDARQKAIERRRAETAAKRALDAKASAALDELDSMDSIANEFDDIQVDFDDKPAASAARRRAWLRSQTTRRAPRCKSVAAGRADSPPRGPPHARRPEQVGRGEHAVAAERVWRAGVERGGGRAAGRGGGSGAPRSRSGDARGGGGAGQDARRRILPPRPARAAPDVPVVNESATPATMTKCAKALRAEVMALAAFIGGGAADADRLAQAMLAARNAHAKVVGDAQFLARNNTSIAPALDHLDNALESFGSSVDQVRRYAERRRRLCDRGRCQRLCRPPSTSLIAATEPAAAKPTTPAGGLRTQAAAARRSAPNVADSLRHVRRRRRRRQHRSQPTRARHRSLR
jgi:actin-related protein